MKAQIELKGFTPLLDSLVKQYDLITAAVYGAMWRYAQQENRECHASLDTIALRAGTSRKTVERRIKDLCGGGFLIDLTPDLKHAPHHYACTDKANLIGVMQAEIGKSESPTSDQGKPESLTRSVTESYLGRSESLTKKQDKKQDKKQASSASADHSRPISLLSEKEVKELKLPLSEWKEYLEDEQAERSRKGIVKFLEKKIAVGPLLPDTEDSKMLFEKLGNEAQAKGRNPPGKFPTLACKEKFTAAAGNLNGTLEAAINSGLEAGITAIPRLVNYISSPKWQQGELKNGQGRTKTSQSETNSQTPGSSNTAGDIPIGSGQTPEMRARLEAHFGGG